MSEKTDKIPEWCPHCCREVELENKFEIQACPVCKNKIAPCCLCVHEYPECSKCPLCLDGDSKGTGI